MAEHVRIDLGTGEFACGNLLLKENIEFTVRPALWFRKTEVSPDETEEASSSPKESGLGAPIPGAWVEHTWCKDVGNDGTDVIKVSSEDDGFLAETGRG